MSYDDGVDKKGSGVLLYFKYSLKVGKSITFHYYELNWVDLYIGSTIYLVLVV